MENQNINKEIDASELAEKEKSKLISASKMAKELDEQEQNKMRQPLEGTLSKYTNVVKGWQFRWFVLSPSSGMLEYYYMSDEVKKHRPRGAVFLSGAVISPSDEDSQTFTISPAYGESYKLRATNAKERQFWVNRLRAVAQLHTDSISDFHPSLKCSSPPSTASSGRKDSLESTVSINTTFLPGSLSESLVPVKKMLHEAEKRHYSLARAINDLPSDGKHATCIDTDLLILKATSFAALQSLERCYNVLHEYELASSHLSGLPPGASVKWMDGSHSPSSNASFSPQLPRLGMNAALS